MGVLSASRWQREDGNDGKLELLEAFLPSWIESYATLF